MRIKVAHVLDTFDIAGPQNGVVNIINGLDQDRFAHCVCTVRHMGDSRSRINRSDVTFHELGKKPGNDIRIPFKLAGIFLKEKPDVVHTRNWGAADAIIGASLARVPAIVHSEHGRESLHSESEPWRRVLMRRLLLHWVDHVFTVTHELRRRFHQSTGLHAASIGVLPNGVDVQRFGKMPITTSAKRKELGLADGDFVLGSVGRFDAVKDQMTLTKAFVSLSKRHTNLRLVIVGQGPLQSQVQEYLSAHGLNGQVRILKSRADVPELLQIMDLFVVCSLYEGSSNALLEAMAGGRPVIATNTGGNPELIIDGQSGLLFPSGDTGALIQLIEGLIRSPEMRLKLGCQARKRVEAEFNLTTMLARYAQLYTTLGTRRSSRPGG